MAKEPPHRHNGGPLSEEDAEKLWGHIRALEVLAEQKAEISDDEKARKALAKSDGFDTNIVSAILKRRKNGHGETAAADQILRLYEEALEDQGALPLEQTRQPKTPPRSDVNEVAQRLHGQEAPEGLEKDEEGTPVINTGDVLEYLDRAILMVRTENKASTSWLQRHFGIGYNSAARLIERMEKAGIISAPDHVGRRTVVDPLEKSPETLEDVEKRLDAAIEDADAETRPAGAQPPFTAPPETPMFD